MSKHTPRGAQLTIPIEAVLETPCQPDLHHEDAYRRMAGRLFRQEIQRHHNYWLAQERGRENRELHSSHQAAKYAEWGRGYTSPPEPADEAFQAWRDLSDAYHAWAGTTSPRPEYTEEHKALLFEAFQQQGSRVSWRTTT